MSANIKNPLNELKSHSVLLSPLSKELGLSPSALSPNKPLAVSHFEPLRKAIRKCGMILYQCGTSEIEAREALRKADVRIPQMKRSPSTIRALGDTLLEMANS